MSEDNIEIIEHTADWAIRVTGADLGQLFSGAALGMAMLLLAEREELPCDDERMIRLEAHDVESLLVDWLSELAYWAEAQGFVICAVDVTEVDDRHFVGRVTGGKAPVLDKHIKAVTYHNLAVEETDAGLEVTIVFDV